MTTKKLTIFSTTIDSSFPYSSPLTLPFPPFSSGSFSLSFLEAPIQCAPTLLCVPIAATLRLTWSGFVGEKLRIKRGDLSFEREGTRRERNSVGIEGGMWPKESEGFVESKGFAYPGREKMVKVRFELEVEIGEKEEESSLTRSLDVIDGRTAMDVCLVFPRERNRRLFASSTVLSNISPYWKAQLSTSGFNEYLIGSLNLDDVDEEEEDSDYDTDFDSLSSPPSLPPMPPNVRTIAIYGTSYTTYRSLLCYLYTSHLSFAPLDSSFASSSKRQESLSLLSAWSPSSHSLTPCSPKSLYILSHFLSIPSLTALSLKAYIDALNPTNIFEELFSTFVERYEQVREAVVGWVFEEGKGRWDVLRRSEGMREWKERVRREGVSEGEMEVLLRLSGIEEGSTTGTGEEK